MAMAPHLFSKHRSDIISLKKSVSQNFALVTFILIKYDDFITCAYDKHFTFRSRVELQNLALISSKSIQKSQSISLLLYVQWLKITNSHNGNDL